MQRYIKDKIQTNNSSFLDKIQTNNLKLQYSHFLFWHHIFLVLDTKHVDIFVTLHPNTNHILFLSN